MPKNSERSRISGDVLPLDYRKTAEFFQARGHMAGDNPLTATMYQDADLAVRRDLAEKAMALPLLKVTAEDRVLDLGCGSGRWVQAIASEARAYLGIDFSESLLDVARAQYPAVVFQAMNVADLKGDDLAVSPPFSLLICSGILAYINDADIVRLFAEISHLAADHCRIYLREPMAKEKRLTLDRFWSEELQTHYSAIYRTPAEYIDLLSCLEGFEVKAQGEPFPRELQNRAETEQRYIFLSR